MVTFTEMRALYITSTASTKRPLHLSAASGLVCVGSTIYVIADDELHLGVFSKDLPEPGRLVRLFAGGLPDEKAARKRMKPDLEALTFVPPFENFPHGALLTLGSGSRPNRGRGALVALNSDGTVLGPPRELDMSPILGSLHDAFDELNIEGAVIIGDELRLFQRGNKGLADNAIISYSVWHVLAALQTVGTNLIRPSAVNRFNLGYIAGVPYCFTDATALANGDIVFCAVAEDTENAYRDGPCIGAAIGIVSHDGQLLSMQQCDQPHKVEGISARENGGVVDLLLVTDPDDAEIPAVLLSASIAR
ncbi:DUF6929 family protein [Pararhizobium arenae]|uniref:DUF6929 family protein n=1 Tax=Pararhizobium arenae TaxID=1856850 RepID=UPI00094B15FA|nr:hypothetical protein [Pararhizobium arenae]